MPPITNENPWRGNFHGRTSPVIQGLPVLAGSSQAITKGAICYIATAAGPVTPFSAVTNNLLGAVVIAAEHQLVTDPARIMDCIIPSIYDIFEFALDAGTAIAWGDELQWNAAGLKKSTTDAIAFASKVVKPASGTTWPTITAVHASFKKASLTAKGKEFPWIGDDVGDAA